MEKHIQGDHYLPSFSAYDLCFAIAESNLMFDGKYKK